MREILMVFSKIADELKLNISQWPFIVPVVKMAQNTHVTKNRADRTSIEQFFGRKPATMTSLVLYGLEKNMRPIPWTAEKWTENVKQLAHALENMHRKVVEIRCKRNEQNQRQRQQNKTRKCNISRGDYVLWAAVA